MWDLNAEEQDCRPGAHGLGRRGIPPSDQAAAPALVDHAHLPPCLPGQQPLGRRDVQGLSDHALIRAPVLLDSMNRLLAWMERFTALQAMGSSYRVLLGNTATGDYRPKATAITPAQQQAFQPSKPWHA